MSIVTDAVLAEVQVKVALAPTVMVAGEAANVTAGSAAGVATTPTQPVNKPVAKLRTRDINNW